MCKHRTVELQGVIAAGPHKSRIPVYTCTKCQGTVVVRDGRIVTPAHREFL